jgi:hypothetical protein
MKKGIENRPNGKNVISKARSKHHLQVGLLHFEKRCVISFPYIADFEITALILKQDVL